MAKFKPDFSGEMAHTPKQFLSGTNLSEIKQVEPSKLKPNPKNTEYFSQESEEYFANLEKDIRERGIIVPLLAKEDGTLLAGHNRLTVAERLKLKFVPVQYVKQAISESDEQAFVIKDNFLRRQLSNDERMKLYRILYPNFDERIAEGMKQGKPKPEALNAKKIAEDTGQKITAVQKQFERLKKSKPDNVGLSNPKPEKPQKNTIVAPKNNNDNSYNPKREAIQSVDTVRVLYPYLPEKDKKEVLRTVEKLLKDLQK
jgi:hypothetical protein